MNIELLRPQACLAAVDIHLPDKSLVAGILVKAGAGQAPHAEVNNCTHHLGIIDQAAVVQQEPLMFSSVFHTFRFFYPDQILEVGISAKRDRNLLPMEIYKVKGENEQISRDRGKESEIGGVKITYRNLL